MNCLDEEKLFALVDDAASEKDAKVWRQHVDGCEMREGAEGYVERARRDRRGSRST